MPINIGSFKTVENSSWLSGARRIVVKGDAVLSKGLWQQIKMSFMEKHNRKDLNIYTIQQFRKALIGEYGQQLVDLAEKNDQMLITKQKRGTKLLSRDVQKFIQICDKTKQTSPQSVGSIGKIDASANTDDLKNLLARLQNLNQKQDTGDEPELHGSKEKRDSPFSTSDLGVIRNIISKQKKAPNTVDNLVDENQDIKPPTLDAQVSGAEDDKVNQLAKEKQTLESEDEYD